MNRIPVTKSETYRDRNRFLRLRAPLILSGIVLGFSFPPFDLYYLAWFALIPLFHNWKQSDSVRETFLDAYIMFFSATMIAMWWPMGHPRFHVAMASLGGILLLPLLYALPFTASKALGGYLKVDVGWPTLIASFLLVEFALGRGPFAFPWLLLGHSQSTSVSFNQIAELGGVPLLTLWVLLMNLGIYVVFQVQPFRTRAIRILVLTVLIVVPFTFSTFRRNHLPEPTRYVAVGLIQPGVDARSWADQTDLERIRGLLYLSDSLSMQNGAKPDLIVWPETAIPALPDENIRSAVYHLLERWSDSTRIPLLTGAIVAGNDSKDGTFYNSAILFEPGLQQTRYDKRWLVPYAEHVPLSTYFSFTSNWTVNAGGVRSYLPGQSQVLLTTKETHSGVLICFESLFGNYARRYVEKGAHLLVVLTQDGWWGRTPGYIQHFAFNRLRAIETRRTVVQVSVNGITGIIHPDGSVGETRGWMQRGGIVGKLPVQTVHTVYTGWGDWISVVATFIALCSYSRVFVFREKHKGRKSVMKMNV